MTITEVRHETPIPRRRGVVATLGRGAAQSDADLVAAALRNENWAWAVLVERYSALVSSVAWSYRMRHDDAAEIRQVVWSRLFENMHRIRDTERIAGWIRTVARNECQRVVLRNRREVLGVDEGAFDRSGDDRVGHRLLAQERQTALRRALDRLPERERFLLESQIADPALTYAELATRLNMARGSLGPTRRRCLSKLRAAPELSGLGAGE